MHKDEEVRNCLDVIQEECAEIIQAVSKIKRFGFKSCNPYKENAKPNDYILLNEYGDLQGSFDKLLELIFTDFETEDKNFDIICDQRFIKPGNIDRLFEISKGL